MVRNLFLLSLLFISCQAVFVDNISDEQISVFYPLNDQKKTGLVDFEWNYIEGANRYVFQIVKPNFDFISEVLLDTIISQTNYKFNLEPGVYQWRVKAINSEYQTDYIVNSLIIN